MSFADRAKNPPGKGHGGNICSVRRVLEVLSAEESVELMGMLADTEAWPADALEAAIHAEGHKVGKGQVRKHRTGQCACPKPSS